MKAIDIKAAVIRQLLSGSGRVHTARGLAHEIGVSGGRIHPLLRELEAAGWLTSSWDRPHETTVPRTRLYLMTGDGATQAATWMAAYAAFDRDRLGSAMPDLPTGTEPIL